MAEGTQFSDALLVCLNGDVMTSNDVIDQFDNSYVMISKGSNSNCEETITLENEIPNKLEGEHASMAENKVLIKSEDEQASMLENKLAINSGGKEATSLENKLPLKAGGEQEPLVENKLSVNLEQIYKMNAGELAISPDPVIQAKLKESVPQIAKRLPVFEKILQEEE